MFICAATPWTMFGIEVIGQHPGSIRGKKGDKSVQLIVVRERGE